MTEDKKGWLARNAETLNALAATATALLALAALVGVKVQLDAADLTQRGQSAREAYRAHLAMSVERPQFARPADACATATGDTGAAYEAYVEHLLYAAEQMLAVSEGWEGTFQRALGPHAPLVCGWDDLSAYDDRLGALLAQSCQTITPCP